MRKFLNFLRNLFWAPKHITIPIQENKVVEEHTIEVKQEVIETLPIEIPVETIPAVEEVKEPVKPKRKRGRPRKKKQTDNK